MLSRHWGALFAAIGLTIVAFGSGAYFSALGYGHSEEQCAKPAEGAAYTEQDCPRQIDTDRHGLPYLAESIASNPEPKDSDEREQRDLAAQESMSVWAFWMMAFSAVGIVITSIGTGFLLWQIILTRRAVADTGEATEAMRAANKIAQENSHRQLQAYLAVNSVTIDYVADSDELIKITLGIQNTGPTPADLKKVVLVAHWIYKGGSIVLVNSDTKNSVRVHRDTPMNFPVGFKDDAPELNNPGYLMTFGRIEYLDVFGRTHKEQFSFQTPADFKYTLYDAGLPLSLAVFSAVAILEGIEAEKEKRKKQKAEKGPAQ